MDVCSPLGYNHRLEQTVKARERRDSIPCSALADRYRFVRHAHGGGEWRKVETSENEVEERGEEKSKEVGARRSEKGSEAGEEEGGEAISAEQGLGKRGRQGNRNENKCHERDT